MEQVHAFAIGALMGMAILYSVGRFAIAQDQETQRWFGLYTVLCLGFVAIAT